MVIYIDVLFCLNLFVNYFLLLTVGTINKITTSFWHRLLGSTVGALISMVIFFPQMNFLIDTAFKLSCSALIVFCTFSFGGIRRFLRLFAMFFGVSFGYAGAMLAVWFIFKPSGMAVNNSIVYFNISPMLLIVSTVACYIIIKIICFFGGRRSSIKNIYTIEINYNGRSVCFDALLDTGNNLRDLFNGDPVIIVEYAVIETLLTEKAKSVIVTNKEMTQPDVTERFRLIPYSAIGSKGLLPAFRPESAIIRFGKKCYQTDKVTVAINKQPIHSEYKALIGEDIARILY